MRAAEFYEQLEEVSSGETRDMFRELKEMERNHMATAKRRYIEMREAVVGFRAF